MEQAFITMAAATMNDKELSNDEQSLYFAGGLRGGFRDEKHIKQKCCSLM